MKIAVIGGGLFGCTAAVYLARAGHDVHLFEAKSNLMCGATASTFARLHRGYHYPRSPETGRESRRAEASFREEYGEAVIDGGRQGYLVAHSRSHVTPEQFRRFLDNEWLACFQDGNRFDVIEPRVHLADLQSLVRRRVAEAGIALSLGNRITRRAAARMRGQFDRIVVASYARLNEILAGFGCDLLECKFQVVERPIVKLPASFANQSVVVIDGPYGCIDPLDWTGHHILGHVTRSIHSENTGYRAEVPTHLAPLLDRGAIANVPFSRYPDIAADLDRYLPGVGDGEHIGSTFTVRAVLSGVETSDKRPTITTRHDEQVISVFSGKLGTAVKAAESVVEMVEKERSQAA